MYGVWMGLCRITRHRRKTLGLLDPLTNSSDTSTAKMCFESEPRGRGWWMSEGDGVTASSISHFQNTLGCRNFWLLDM